MFVRTKARTHLFVRMDVVSEVSQRVAELFDIDLQMSQFAGDVNELRERPLVELFNVTCSVSRTIRCLIKLLGVCAGNAQQEPFQNAAAVKDHCQWRVCFQTARRFR